MDSLSFSSPPVAYDPIPFPVPLPMVDCWLDVSLEGEEMFLTRPLRSEQRYVVRRMISHLHREKSLSLVDWCPWTPNVPPKGR